MTKYTANARARKVPGSGACTDHTPCWGMRLSCGPPNSIGATDAGDKVPFAVGWRGTNGPTEDLLHGY
jgi:hypothetical protein